MKLLKNTKIFLHSEGLSIRERVKRIRIIAESHTAGPARAILIMLWTLNVLPAAGSYAVAAPVAVDMRKRSHNAKPNLH